jgi:hypothetical protein
VAAAVVGRIREFASAVPRDAHITGHRARVALAWGALAVGLAIAVGGVAVLCMPRTPQAHASVMAVVPPSAVAPTPPETTAPAPTPEPAPAPAPGVQEPVVPEAVRDVPRPVAPPPPPPPPPPSTALSAGAAKGASADLLQAIDLGDTTKVRALLKADPSLAKTRGEKGSTPLHWLAKSATVQAGAAADIAEQLIAAGAEVDARTEQGETPLLTAAWSSANKGALVVATALLAHRADVNAKDKDGNTPLSAALAPEFCTLLTEHGAKE